ncbi:rab11 family-interacting protein 1 isoform X2 [Gouania willdenowi]|nr:rab11 family-interacting protein 1-like isoform X2 [Gouania willdenowi]XP_028315510.1 rab11 family-interacting protein 1-like isoform X2 [Gouania willdenowi]
MTASMFDLTMKDKPRSAFGKLKDRVTGKRRGDMESSSAIVPGRYAALSASPGPFGEEFGGDVMLPDVGTSEEKRNKMKDFFTGRLRKSSDTRSCSSLASESSVSSITSEKFSPPPILMSDPPSSPIYTTKVRVDSLYGETDLAKKVLTSQHTTKVLTHKRAFSDEASKITTALPRANPTLESIKGQVMTQSKSSLCINGNHVYESEPSTPKSSGALPSKLVLLEKCSPLSRSLQNLTKKSEDKGSFAEGRHWSFDKTKKEETQDEKEAQMPSHPTHEVELEDRTVQSAMPITSSAAGSPEKGRKLRKTLFSSGRSESLPARSDLNQTGSTTEGRLRGWFGTGDSQNKPRLEVSAKVENRSDAPPPLPPRPSPYSPTSGHVSHDVFRDTIASPTSTPISPSIPFLPNLQRSPFFDKLIAEELQKSPTFVPCSSGSSPLCPTAEPFHPCLLRTPQESSPSKGSIKRERPRAVSRQTSLPVLQTGALNLPHSSVPRSMSESTEEHDDDSFDVFASSRLHSPEHTLHPKQTRTSPSTSRKRSHPSAQEQLASKEELLPLPLRRLLKTSAKDIYSDGWLHRGQELAVHKEAYLLSQTGVASLQRSREAECKRSKVSPDTHTCTGNSDSLSINTNVTTPSEIPLSESLKRFKYEPLEDVTDCWGGMLFEQDLYGRVCRGKYGHPKEKNHRLSLHADENVVTMTSSDSAKIIENEFSVTDLLKMSYTDSIKKDIKTHQILPGEGRTAKAPLPVTSCINNNTSFPLTLGDLNMNVNSSDFGFIDSDGSSQSEVTDTLKESKSVRADIQQLSEDPQMIPCDDKKTYDGVLKDTHLHQADNQDSSQNSQSELNNEQLDGESTVNIQEILALMVKSIKLNPLNVENEGMDEEYINCEDSDKIQKDDNGNKSVKGESSPEAVSVRLRPKGLSRQSSNESPNSWRKSGDREFIDFLSLVQNISEDFCEEPMPNNSMEAPLFYSQVVHKEEELSATNDRKNLTEFQTTPAAFIEKVNSSHIPFEHLHVKVAPNSRSPSSAKNIQTLQQPEPFSPSIPPTLTPIHCHNKCPTSMEASTVCSTTLAAASNTYSYSTTSTFTNDQALVDAPHSLLPEETHPASNLPSQESRSHPVKPLTSSPTEKKESRSVLEKLRSTIHPGRSAHQASAEPEKRQEVTVDNSAQYQHLTNMELISLLLQQEMDMQKQQAASERQDEKLEKCEAELKKVKAQVRDMEDYIDNLLLRIMEQTPTLLQVRSRHK